MGPMRYEIARQNPHRERALFVRDPHCDTVFCINRRVGPERGGSAGIEQEVALVIGNGSYPTSPVGTAVADAKAIAELLKAGGFDVVYAQDARRADLDSAIEQFSRKLERGATAVVYFAGHAIQNQDRNFLIPVDATIASDADLRSNTVDVDLILDPLIVARPRGSVVLLDAASKNPWQQKVSARGSGLANVSPIEGITQAYPAAPGQIVEDQKGPEGLFASEFIRTAKAPDRTFKEAFRLTRAAVAKASRNKEVPWETSLNTADFVVTPHAAPAEIASRAISRLGPSDAVEQGFWDTIKNSDSAANFQAYLDAYPNGPFASAARQRLQSMGALSSPAKPPVVANASASTIRDCPQCPELVLIPSGSFSMGSTEVFSFEGPIHRVSIGRPFYIGRYEVTFEEWDACVNDRGCTYRPDDAGAGRGRRPSRMWIGTMQKPMLPGCRRKPERPIDCQRKANGSTPRGRRPPQPIPGGDRWTRTGQTAPVHQSAAFQRDRSRLVQAECVRRLRHGRQCRGVGRGLLERGVSRGAGRRLGLGQTRMPRTSHSWRLLQQRRKIFAVRCAVQVRL